MGPLLLAARAAGGRQLGANLAFACTATDSAFCCTSENAAMLEISQDAIACTPFPRVPVQPDRLLPVAR